jgi:TonB family protein
MKNFLQSGLCFAALAAIAISWAAALQQSDTTHPSAAGDTGKGLSGLGPGGPQKCRQFKGDIICRVGGEVSAPKLIVPEQRDYQPPTLLSNSSNAGCPCTVVLSVVVGRDGLVHAPRVVRHVDAELDGMAIEWVKKWRFQPARKGDKPVAVETDLEVRFR